MRHVCQIFCWDEDGVHLCLKNWDILGPKGIDDWSHIGIGIVMDAVMIFKMTIVDGCI